MLVQPKKFQTVNALNRVADLKWVSSNHDIAKLISLDICENRICLYGDIDTDADVQATWTIPFAANYDAIRITIGLGSPVQSGYLWQLTKPAPGHMGHDCHLLGAKLIKSRSWSWPMLNYVIL